MKVFKCIIVDDEPLAINVIKNYLDKLSNFEVTAACSNALEAFDILIKENIDLMFLDIQMPELSGIDFIKSLNQKPVIILTTAFRNYAVESYELDVLDYLIKPISLDRLLKAIQKLQNAQGLNKQENANHKSDENNADFIYIKEGKRNVRIILKDILYIESMKDYIKIFLQDEKIITKMSISCLEDTLPKESFIRIHRSFIVPIGKIKAFSASKVEIDDKNLPIGNTYKSPVLRRLEFLAKS